jgi:hypothetical protein
MSGPQWLHGNEMLNKYVSDFYAAFSSMADALNWASKKGRGGIRRRKLSDWTRRNLKTVTRTARWEYNASDLRRVTKAKLATREELDA